MNVYNFVYRVIAAAKHRLTYITEGTEDIDLSDHQKLPDALIDLSNYSYTDLIQRSLMLLDRYYTSKSDIFQKATLSRLLIKPKSVELFDSMESSMFLKLMSFLKPGSETDDKDTSVVQKLTEYCWLKDEAEGYEPHHINQNIILSFG